MLHEEEQMEKSMQILFMEISRRYAAKCFQKLVQKGIQPGQVPFLMMLCGHDGCSQREMAQRLEIKAPTVNVSIRRLEKAGIVYRKRDEKDQRIMRIFLTEQGKKTVNEIKEFVEETEKIMFGNFSDAELCLLRRFFRQILDNMDHIPGPPVCKCKRFKENMEKEGLNE